jgi:uncharacterized Ntn-hydrolase superfamily protein
MPWFSTFSIVAFEPHEPAWGIAVASKFPAVGAVVPWAASNAGAIATQSYANTSYGPRGLELLASGLSAQETLDILIADDEERELRQVGIVDAQGWSATYTGKDCFEWAGGLTGDHVAVQGNILAGRQVVEAMHTAYIEASGDLPARLLTALRAGDLAGGDRRGKQSAALFVVKSKAGYGGFNDRWIDYRVDDHPDPVTRLADLLELHRLYFGKSPSQDEITIEGQVAERLQAIMHQLGYYQGPLNGEYDPPTQEALRQFLGNENFEDRTDFEAGRIDQPVYRFLLQKFES